MNVLDPAPQGNVFLIPFNMMPTPMDKPIPPTNPPEPKAKGLTDEQKEARWQAYAFKTEKQELKFIDIFKGLLDEQSGEVISNYRNLGNAEFDHDASVDKFKKAFQPLITTIYSDAFDDVIQDIGQRSVKQVSPEALEWIENRSLEMAASINLTTREALRRALAEGFSEGESIPQITRRIKGFFKETYKGRAKKIARAEVIAASNEGALRGYEGAGIEKAEFYGDIAEWSDDCGCGDLIRNVYPIDEAHGMIPVHPNCRCTWIPIV